MIHVMKTDHSEFIHRHHDRQGIHHETGSRKSLRFAVVASIAALYIVLISFVVHMAKVDQTTMVVSMLVFLTATIVAFAARRAQYLQARQEKELILLKEVLEGSRGGRLITDSADNTLYYNQRFQELCQMPDGTEQGYKQLINMFSDNDKAESLFNALSDYAHRGLTDSIELYCTKRDYEGWYNVTAQPVAGHAGFIHWRIDNVTDQHTANRAVREEREKLIDFTDNAPVGFFSLDESGRFVFMNATMGRWLGQDLKDLLGGAMLHTYLCAPPKKSNPYDLIENGTDKQIVDIEMKGAAGKTFYASINQSIMRNEDGSVRTRAVVHDLTSEQEMRQALKASEERFKRFYEEAPLGIVLVNKDGLIENCNSEFARMMGKNTEDIESKHFKLLIADEDRDAVLGALKRMEDGKPMAESMEVCLHGIGD
jgi:two-component system cell cycle sensor histidine kinase/response regulator CckA